MKIGIICLALVTTCSILVAGAEPAEANDQHHIEICDAVVDTVDDIQTVYKTSDGNLWAVEHELTDYTRDTAGQRVKLVFDQHDPSTLYDDEIIGVYVPGRQLPQSVNGWEADYV